MFLVQNISVDSIKKEKSNTIIKKIIFERTKQKINLKKFILSAE